MATKLTLEMNEIHKPSVSFIAPDDGTSLDETVLNGKLYITKSWLRDQGFKPGGSLEITIAVKN